ncbi:neprosin family prolyl endopeptidase [Xanthomonas fragariae]|nr:neprosin family prolyl endopeptidase [Xanthomonas fragariae]MBL9198765.1 neprosin family prolyl endopeptidase [Xanthomonas fragariae]MBL9220125.1 neprosin family prolyl endopeptidase [Xanthomonas fragariae]MDM7555192.1 neprosin family prolyl endopeptidase [Xanthomonas fragariae]MDM7558306.1 neprosin family prolyl endopeptidase [Xanthomonas fragariae]MDM7573463.1 neprosin family prolyl endopeptidase [Xanthomonas fragariae]
MTFRFNRAMSIARPIAALFVCAIAPASVAATLLPPSISAIRDRNIDTLMPPLLRTPATARVAAGQADTVQRSTTSASRAFPQVTRDFKQFLDAQAQVSYATRDATSKVADQTAFAEMQRYLFNRYNGLTVVSSLHQGTQVFDCIPQAQQPGLRNDSHIAQPPNIASFKTPSGSGSVPQRCAAGTIPLQRIGITDLTRHADLNAFLHANARPVSAAPAAVAPAAASDTHFYSSVFLDTAGTSVTGAGADINLWAPALRNADEMQTISQIWIVGESASKQTQTLEVGWEIQPAAGWGNKPIIFVYSTQDGYVKTGCHNLDCSDFVQTSTQHVLGAQPAAGFSTAGSKQTMLGVEFQRNTDGNWWLRLDGEWIGYYNAALYSGDLANGRVAYVSAGGEISTDSGAASPRMGSCQFAAAGYRQAAFQANHFYRDAAMTAHPVQRLSSLDVLRPSCYTLAIAGYAYPYALSAGITRTTLSPEMQNGGFYFGGPAAHVELS